LAQTAVALSGARWPAAGGSTMMFLGGLRGGCSCTEGRKNPVYALNCTLDRKECPHCRQSLCSYHFPVNNAGKGGLLGAGANMRRAYGGHSGCTGPDESAVGLLGVARVRLRWRECAAARPGLPAGADSLRLLTYNAGLLRLGPWANPPYVEERFPHLSGGLLRSGADIVAVQEIYEKPHIDELLRQVGAMFPFHARVDSGTVPVKFHNGLMFLSKFPIEAQALHIHTHAASIEKLMGSKSMLVAKVLSPLGKLLLVNMHTTAGGTHPEGVDAIRQSELKEALMVCEDGSREGYRSMVVGDLNAGPEASPINYGLMLDSGYTDLVLQAAGEADMRTWDPENPLNKTGPHASGAMQRIDHMLAHPQAGIVARTAQRVFTESFVPTAIGPVTLSDHYGVLATLALHERWA